MIQIQTTVDSKSNANKIANFLVERRLAACVQISQIESIYRWKGKIEKTKEYQITIKGNSPKLIIKELKKIHPYEVPEILELKTKASKSYSNWLKKESN